MIGLLFALQAAPVHIGSARALADPDRVVGQGILFRCEVPLNGAQIAWGAALDGEITGVGQGPLALAADASAPIRGFKSYRGMVSYDEKLGRDRRPLFVSLDTHQKIAGAAYGGELRFTYRQDGSSANRVDRAALVRGARLTVFKARDLSSSNGLRFPKKGASPVAVAACTASDRNTQ